jgi:hypothetical protein
MFFSGPREIAMHPLGEATVFKSVKFKSSFRARRLALPLLAAYLLPSMGCSSGTSYSGSNAVSDIPAPAQYNTYVGTQAYIQSASNGGALVSSGGVWSAALDDTNHYFTYKNVSFSTAAISIIQYPILGSFTSSNGFFNLSFNGKAAGSGGYAYEIPGRAALLRPGDTTHFPVVAVPMASCPEIPSTTFQFVALGIPAQPGSGASTVPVNAAYGSVQLNASGTAWNFSSMKMFAWDGTSLSPTTPPSGQCGSTQEGFAATVLPVDDTNKLPLTVGVGPSGYFVMDQGQGDQTEVLIPPPTPTGPFGLVGVAQPSSPLDTSKVVAGKYAGFKFSQGKGGTQPVVFGQTPGSGTMMTGGGFANDDITKTPATNISIDLGQQDPQNNGLYKSVTVTVPDTSQGCIFQPYGGKDAQGNDTCILHGVAVVGNPEGKYALFITGQDQSLLATNFKRAVLEFFLYPQ